MTATRSSQKAKAPVADTSEGASASAPVDVSSSSPKEGVPSETVEDSTTTNGASAAASIDIPSKTAEGAVAVDEDSLATTGDTPNKTAMSPTTANGTVEKQSPKGKKRAVPEPTEEQEPTTKKTKESPQTTPKSSPKQEGSPTAESSNAVLDETPITVTKENWQGFCDIENEPAFFSVILREIGVTNVTVRQVLMLDPDILATMPNPIFGLILCYRHRNFDVAIQETTCPTDIWFANQMPAQNSCATLAMIHTMMNTDNENIDIGEHMYQFKEYSKSLTPFQRGQAFASWQYVKKIHNSFAKKMDIYQADDSLSREIHDSEKAKRKAATKLAAAPKAKKNRGSASPESDASDPTKKSFEENAQHYIAFVPRDGTVWKLDGMNTFPTRIGTYDSSAGESWTDTASDRIQALMAAGGDTEYSVFAIAQSPLVELRKEIVETDNTIKAVGRRLDVVCADWTAFVPAEDVEPPSPSWLGGFTEEDREEYPVPDEVAEEIAEEGVEELLPRRAELIGEFRRLVTAWTTEEQAEADEMEAADKRRVDLGPLVKRWLEMLAENGQLEGLASEFPAK